MGDSNSIVNLGDLTKPATVLIEKISDAVGSIYKPFQIKRIAKAEAEAEIIRANTNIEINDLQRRAMVRFFTEEAKKQNNIEAITSKALPEVTERARPDQIEDDWITHFFDKCRLISDEQMQSLWARVLAGQANSPGKYSKRTVEILSYLEKREAKMFSLICSYIWNIDDSMIPIIYDFDHFIYTENINFPTLLHLESLGLIQMNTTGFARLKLAQKVISQYFDNKMWIELQRTENNKLNLGYVILTLSGKQLAPISGAQPIVGFFDYVKDKWESFGFNVYQDEEQTFAEDVDIT